MISKMKFHPIRPKIRNAPMLGNVSLTPLSRNGRKKIKQHATKIPVFIIGTNKLMTTKAKIVFFFCKSGKMKPATRPAIVHLLKQAMTVPTGLIGIKIANVDGENSAIMPLKKPTIAPEIGPPNAAAKTIVTSERLMFTGPSCT